MGGIDKAQVRLDGVRLLDRVLVGVSGQVPAPTEVVVVSPYDVPVPDGVRVVSEDPPFGGPAAGVAAGFAALGSCETVLVFSVDAPDSPRVAGRLLAALSAGQDSDVAVVRAPDGHLQPLCAAWRADALARALDRLGNPRDVAAKRLLGATDAVIELDGDGDERDYDTVAELSERGRVDLPEE